VAVEEVLQLLSGVTGDQRWVKTIEQVRDAGALGSGGAVGFIAKRNVGNRVGRRQGVVCG